MNRYTTLTTFALIASSGAGVAHAEPPAQDTARDKVDPRTDLLARQHAYFVTKMFTADLFASVHGKHADLCRVDHRDASGEVTQSHWVRFGKDRWDLAYSLGPDNWVRYRAYLDEEGRLLHLAYGAVLPPRATPPYRYDWSPEGAFARADSFGRAIEYTVDADAPELLRYRMHDHRYVIRSSEGRLEWWDEEPARLRHAFVWGADGSFTVRHDTGQSDVEVRYGAHGALIRREEAPQEGRSSSIARHLSTRFDDQGRLERVTQQWGDHDDITIHPVYGCTWPAEAEVPAPPVQAGGGR
jgi:hypothetical protein